MIINQECNLASDFIKAMGAAHSTSDNGVVVVSISVQQGRWKLPRAYYIKLNCDARWCKDSSSVTVGIVARGDQEDYKWAFFKQFKSVTNAFATKALANREGLQFAWVNKFSAVEIESDCKEIVRVLNGEIRTPMEVEVVVEDILYLTRYWEVKFQYVRRAINNVAHCVAQWDHRGGGGDGS
ncbi:hypothetical protein LIER_10038 [Lithospermum erythrorhizon]|uniref:RNase H type-1 domain-containing protein n=1 Tax=Lithospermum erythrorhizon TaxID=34254 RepID=A0AAV3PHY5_LITER